MYKIIWDKLYKEVDFSELSKEEAIELLKEKFSYKRDPLFEYDETKDINPDVFGPASGYDIYMCTTNYDK